MTPMFTRFVCATLSTVGAAGLVAFANPANAVDSGHHAARPTVAVATIAAPSIRG